MQAGYLSRSSHVSRGLRLTTAIPTDGKKAKSVQVQPNRASVYKIGYIYASQPMPVPEDYYYDEDDLVEVTTDMLGGNDPANVYALEVKGDSMIDAMIREGDLVIFRKQETANNGDMVAVWLDDRNETTLKYFFKEKDGSIRLQPANSTMQPIYVNPDHCRIEGKVLSIIRHV